MNLKVSSKSDINKVAGAIAGVIEDNKDLTITTIGAGALNQAIKSIAIARSFTIIKGIDLSFSPSFANIGESESGEQITGIVLKINKKEN